VSEIIVILLLLLWLVALATSHTLGGFVHLLAIAAVLVVVVHLIRGRSAEARP